MPKFRISYFQCCGYAAIEPVVEIEAATEQEARETFPEKVRAQGYACTAQPDDLMTIERLD